MSVDLARNRPCSCGSGKKYKLCCLQKNEPDALTFPAEVRRRAFDALHDFARRPEFAALIEDLIALYHGALFFDLPEDDQQRIMEDKDSLQNMLYWLFLEASFHGPSQTIVNRLLSRKSQRVAPAERRYLEVMRDTHLRLYEVESVALEEGMRLRDCWDGTTHEVRERAATRQLAAGSVVALRLRPEPDGTLVIDGPGFGGLTHADKEAILADLRDEQKLVLEADGNADGRFEFFHGMVIAQHVAFEKVLAPLPKFVTSDGDETVFCTVRFAIEDRPAARSGLARTTDLQHDADGDVYIWVKGKGRTIYASIRIDGDTLVAETQSVKRANAVRRLLAKNLGNAVRYLGTDEQDPMAALAAYRSGRDDEEGDEDESIDSRIPAEIERQLVADYQEQHYRSWIDTPLPALAMKTPRQAARDPQLRRDLVGLLKDFSARAEIERRTNPMAYDFSWMWAELDIDPTDPLRTAAP
jgi:hypothetical protein